MNKTWVGLGIIGLMLSAGPLAWGVADLRPDRIHVADEKKTLAYIRDGLVIGGDQAVNEYVVKDIRRASNKGYERMVIDLEGNRNGEPLAISRAPYFQVSVTPDERRLVFTLYGRPKLAFDSKKVQKAFAKSAVVKNVVLLPRLEDDAWTFALELKKGAPVEVFELANPVRLIIDLKGQAQAATAKAKPVRRAPQSEELDSTLED